MICLVKETKTKCILLPIKRSSKLIQKKARVCKPPQAMAAVSEITLYECVPPFRAGTGERCKTQLSVHKPGKFLQKRGDWSGPDVISRICQIWFPSFLTAPTQDAGLAPPSVVMPLSPRNCTPDRSPPGCRLISRSRLNLQQKPLSPQPAVVSHINQRVYSGTKSHLMKKITRFFLLFSLCGARNKFFPEWPVSINI